ncbi:FtsK-like ATPase domain-containing protein [Pontimonas salivibrio]|uniref:FtsK-like ATPase domain-containing protein n=1 Tax=Pontimonas salivibrio TaxID=1159327 RepID=A0A2L2BRT0_9MICO|nr:FtsK/SpoIIIE domain-containing protein [Pontimonas salivibrio]AVG24361.1 FtsK-like ATPase domain-containing protein [Pontimonas salivibrio]
MISLVMLVIFRSPFALMIGILGPVMALGSWWEAKRSHRLAMAEDVAAEEAGQAYTQATREHEERRIRQDALERHPSVVEWMANPLWRPHSGGSLGSGSFGGAHTQHSTSLPLRVGLDRVGPKHVGPQHGGLDHSGHSGHGGHSGQVISGLPHLVDLAGGVAVVGEGPHATAVYRAVVIQALALWCSRDPERDVHLVWPVDNEGSLPGEPPCVVELSEMATSTAVSPASRAGGVRCERVASQSEVHPQVHTVVLVSGPDQAQVYQDGRRMDQALRPDLLGAPGALWALRRMAQWRRVSPEVHAEAGSSDDRSSLWFSLDGHHSHNLATEGPHALVWGQTGRGKTILLQRLLLDVASRYTPEQFSCVLIDFKGGSGALGLQGLGHLAGVLTDLEPDALRRVHTGVVAEIARRETLLASHSVADISDLPPEVVCPRSIIAIDEIALLVQRDDSFVDLLSDIAARGRSLGLHLVISGQRMTSQVPKGVIVNAGLRFCLGVTDPMEASEYLPGVPEATIRRLHATPPGTTLGLSLGGSPYTSQVVPLGPPEGTQPPAARLWSESLPDVVAPVDGELGLIEQAEKQCLSPWKPGDVASGLVVIVGDVGSGVGEAMARFVECTSASGPASSLPNEPAALLDALSLLTGVFDDGHGTVSSGGQKATGPLAWTGVTRLGTAPQVFAPRLDRVWNDCSEQVQAQLATGLIRAGEALADLSHPGRLVVSSRPGCAIMRSLVRAGAELITLRVSQAELLDQWGINRRYFSPHAPPGRGLWREHPIHWARPRSGREGVGTRLDAEHSFPRPALDQVLAHQRGGLLVVAEHTEPGSEISTLVEQAGWSQAPAHRVFAGGGLESGGLDAALGGPGVIMWGLSPAQMRQVVGHERAPLVSPPDSQAWWVRAQGVRLIDCA